MGGTGVRLHNSPAAWDARKIGRGRHLFHAYEWFYSSSAIVTNSQLKLLPHLADAMGWETIGEMRTIIISKQNRDC